MTAPAPPPEGGHPPPSPPWSNRFLLGLGGVILFVVGVAVGSSGSESSSRPATQGQFTSGPYSSAAPTYSPPYVALPRPEDFTIGVRVLEKKCFGSAGCNVGYQIDPKYTGIRTLPKDPFTVIYEVTGGEDGPQVNNFEVINGESISFPKEERVGTASSGAVLKAKATGVSEN